MTAIVGVTTNLKGVKYRPLCRMPIDVMQSAENAFRDDFAAGAPRRERCRIARRALADRCGREWLK
jgi:hypothetical protein